MQEPPVCEHPSSQVVKGGNQYGTWTKCLMCKAKLSFKKYGPGNPHPNTKKINKASAAASSTTTEAIEDIKAAAASIAKSSKSTEYVTHQEMKNLMRDQADHITSSMTNMLGQLMQTQQQMMHQQATAAAMMATQAAPGYQQQMPVVPHFNLDQTDFQDEEMDNQLQNPNEWEHLQQSGR